MKKIFALLLVFVLATSCFVGCGEGDKNKNKNDNGITSNEGKKEMAFSDISNTMEKMAKGTEVNVKLSIAVKPENDESFLEDEFFADAAKGIIKKNANGLYEIPLTISGAVNDKSANLTLKLCDRKVSDIVVVEGKVYVNAKAAFDFILSLTKDSGESVEIAWPCEGTYIDLIPFVEYVQNLSQQNSDFEPDYDDVSVDFADNVADDVYDEPTVGDSNDLSLFMFDSLDEETKQQINEIVEIIINAVPEETFKTITDVMKNNNVLTMDKEKISFKLDKKNLKNVVLAFVDFARADGSNVIDNVMQAIIKSDKLDENMKALLTEGYDKEEVKEELDKMLDKTEIGSLIDEIIPEIKDTHLYVDMSANENSAKFVIDVLLDGLASSESDISQAAIVLDVECKAEDNATISAPSSVLKEAEINTLLVLISSIFA